MKFIIVAATGGLVLYSSAVFGATTINPVAERMKSEISYKGNLGLPEELGPAMIPYLQCAMRKSGTKYIGNSGDAVEDLSPSQDCSADRENAKVVAMKKLNVMGVVNAQDVTTITENSLLAIDLMTSGNAKWLAKAK